MHDSNTPTRDNSQLLLITRRQAAERLAISLRSLDELLAAGVLPSVKISPRCRRIPAKALDQFVEQQTTGGLQR